MKGAISMRIEGSAEQIADALAGTGTNRDRIYTALRDAGAEGMTEAELRALAGGGVGVHIESLRYEGHGINTAWREVTPTRREQRYWLARDAWGDE